MGIFCDVAVVLLVLGFLREVLASSHPWVLLGYGALVYTALGFVAVCLYERHGLRK